MQVDGCSGLLARACHSCSWTLLRPFVGACKLRQSRFRAVGMLRLPRVAPSSSSHMRALVGMPGLTTAQLACFSYDEVEQKFEFMGTNDEVHLVSRKREEEGLTREASLVSLLR